MRLTNEVASAGNDGGGGWGWWQEEVGEDGARQFWEVEETWHRVRLAWFKCGSLSCQLPLARHVLL